MENLRTFEDILSVVVDVEMLVLLYYSLSGGRRREGQGRESEEDGE